MKIESVRPLIPNLILIYFRMQKTTDPDKAAKAYLEYLHEMETQNVADRDEQGKAHCFLANYYYIRSDYDSSYKHSFKCLEFPEVKDEAKNLLVKLGQAKEEPEPPPSESIPPSEGGEVKMEISIGEEPTGDTPR
jgi:hypothetical protein